LLGSLGWPQACNPYTQPPEYWDYMCELPMFISSLIFPSKHLCSLLKM
jgi:hypothetical protein